MRSWSTDLKSLSDILIDEIFERDYRNRHEQISHDLNAAQDEADSLWKRCDEEGTYPYDYRQSLSSDRGNADRQPESNCVSDDSSPPARQPTPPVPLRDLDEDPTEPPLRKRRYITGGPGGGGRFLDGTESGWPFSSDEELVLHRISGPWPQRGKTSRLRDSKVHTVQHNVKVKALSEMNAKTVDSLELDSQQY